MALRAPWERMPLPLRWVVGLLVLAIGYAVAYTVVRAALPDLGDLGIRLVLLGIAIPLAAVGFVRARRLAGGKEQARLFRRAMRTGIVPEDADVDRWRPLARRQEQYLRGLRGFNRIIWGLLALMLAFAAVYGGVVHGPVWWTFLGGAAVVALIGWAFDRIYGRQHAKAARVADAVEGAGPATPPPGAPT